jgi:TolB-like protein
MPTTRRLAAILAVDVAGYARLMSADEAGTHQRLRAHLRQFVDPKIREHQGRIVKNTGDGVLAEFLSVIDAVQCAAEVQRGMLDREAQLADEQRIKFRIGIKLGDVIVEDEDVFGDGVNVAARLEALAEPGGICVSRTVRDQIRDKLPYPLVDMGEQHVKNIARPVRAFALSVDAVSALPSPDLPRSTIQSSSAPRLSIVVLAFSNLSNDPEQEYLADAIADDLTTDLSRIAGSFVISRSTAFSYKGKSVDAKQLGRELNVRYVLEGSVRGSGDRVRVNAQLIDAETGAHVWAERFDREAGDVFNVQDEITGRVARALQSELIIAEARRCTDHPDVQDYIMRGFAALTKPISREIFAEAESFFEHALALDPHAAEAQVGLARVLISRTIAQLSSSKTADLERANDLVGLALKASPNSAWAHCVKGARAVGKGEI